MHFAVLQMFCLPYLTGGVPRSLCIHKNISCKILSSLLSNCYCFSLIVQHNNLTVSNETVRFAWLKQVLCLSPYFLCCVSTGDINAEISFAQSFKCLVEAPLFNKIIIQVDIPHLLLELFFNLCLIFRDIV